VFQFARRHVKLAPLGQRCPERLSALRNGHGVSLRQRLLKIDPARAIQTRRHNSGFRIEFITH
jgi:hypothetical protein